MAIPVETDTLSECLVPNCGISMHTSAASTAAGSTPCTSWPAIMAYFSPGCGSNCCNSTLSFTCSSTHILYPSFLRVRMHSMVVGKWCHSTDSSAPRAVLCISGDGGVAVMPQSIMRLTRNASDVRKMAPMLLSERTLSSTTVMGNFTRARYCSTVSRSRSQMVFFSTE